MHQEDQAAASNSALLHRADVAQQLKVWLDARHESMISLIVDFVSRESPSNDPAAQRSMMDALEQQWISRGWQVNHLAGHSTGGQLLARPADVSFDAPWQLLLGHSDTVWPLGALQRMPIRRDGGKLSGPGVYDMKAGLVQMLFAIDAIRQLDLTPSVMPLVLINTDEEIGSPESKLVIERLAHHVDRVLVAEPSLGIEGKLKTARKGVTRVTVRVRGRSAHAGLDPESGVNAIVEMASIVHQINALNAVASGTTVNVGTIVGGTRPNVVPEEAVVVVDVRALTTADLQRVETTLRTLKPLNPHARITVEIAPGRPPMEHTPGNRILWSRAQQAACALGITLNEATAGGGSDGSFTSLYAPTLDGLGPVGDGAHASHEFIFTDRLAERAAMLAILILDEPVSAAPRLDAQTRHRAIDSIIAEAQHR